MGEEFQGGVCGGNWWNSSKNLLTTSPCLSTINDLCSFGGMSSSQHGLSTVTSTDDLVSSIPYTNGCLQVQDGAKIHEHMGVSNHNNWNQDFLNNTGKSDGNYSQETTALNTSMNFCEDFSTNSLNQDFALEHNNSNQRAEFLNSASYDYSSSSLLQTMFESDSEPHQLLNNHSVNNYSQAMINDFSPTLPKSCTSDHLKFTNNNTPFWNSNVSVLNNVRPNFPPMQSQFSLPQSNDGKLNISNFTRKHPNEETRKMATKTINEPAVKRPRIETPSPLPTFKVRKEKLGDRVTALQQLVSPFGKTDTASVLHEAIDYIKFLHDQVNVLSAPYMKKGSLQIQGQQAKDEIEGLKQDLRSRGLCLVPITSTFPVSTESPTDFWTPTFGGCFSEKRKPNRCVPQVFEKEEKEVIQQEDSQFLGHIIKSRRSLHGT